MSPTPCKCDRCGGPAPRREALGACLVTDWFIPRCDECRRESRARLNAINLERREAAEKAAMDRLPINSEDAG